MKLIEATKTKSSATPVLFTAALEVLASDRMAGRPPATCPKGAFSSAPPPPPRDRNYRDMRAAQVADFMSKRPPAPLPKGVSSNPPPQPSRDDGYKQAWNRAADSAAKSGAEDFWKNFGPSFKFGYKK